MPPRPDRGGLRLPRALAALLIAAGLSLAAPAGPAVAQQSATLTIPQARDAARQALRDGKPRLAAQLARGMLLADARDPTAYGVLAQAHQMLGDKRLARRAAQYAFRYSTAPGDRFIAAQIAARMAYDEKRYTLAQYWLRRSLDPAPNERLKAQAIRDFKRVQAENPWSGRLRFSVAPSSNVNSGADSPYNLIDGVPVVGTLSGAAQALSGTVATADVLAAYRLHGDRNSQTRLEFRGYVRQVFLSSSARAMAPGFSGSDFSSAFARIGVSHTRRLGQSVGRPRGNGYAKLGLALGQSWYGGDTYYRSIEAEAERGFTLKGGRSLRFSGSLEHRSYPSRADPADTAEIRTEFSQKLDSGARLTAGLILGRTESAAANTTSNRATAYAVWEPAQRVATAKLALTLGAGLLDYPQYRVGIIAVPGGRQDETVFGTLALHFDRLDYAGFSPALSLTARKNSSNISRFDTNEMTLSIGIRSNF